MRIRTALLAITALALLILSLLAVPAGSETISLASGYARIDNYAGLRSGEYLGEDGAYHYGCGWFGFVGIPDFERNAGPYDYLDYNTSSIRTSLRSTEDYYSYNRNRTLWFEMSGPATVNESHGGLRFTDATCDGHVYTEAVFDWTMRGNLFGTSSQYLRLELWAGYPGTKDMQPIWWVQPGAGLHSGHVEITFPETYDISFRVAVATPQPVPEPAGLTALLAGAVGLSAYRRRRRDGRQ